jgi:hypothetical protein
MDDIENKDRSFWDDVLSEDYPVPPANPSSSSEPQKKGFSFPKSKYSGTSSAQTIPAQDEFRITGYPVYNIKWDDLGISSNQQMGYIPNRSMQVEVKDGKWYITGARTNSAMMLFLALGAGGGVYFLHDLIQQFVARGNWSEIGGALVVLLPAILRLIVRTKTIELFPFELDFMGYDSDSDILILSTVTEPGGVVAMKVDLPSGAKAKEMEKQHIISNLRRAHTGFMLFQGEAKEVSEPGIKKWSFWTLIWLLILAYAGWFFYHHH